MRWRWLLCTLGGRWVTEISDSRLNFRNDMTWREAAAKTIGAVFFLDRELCLEGHCVGI